MYTHVDIFSTFSVVVLQTATISKNDDSYHTPNGHNSANTAEMSLYDAVNPGCQDDLIKENYGNINADETLVDSLTDALTAITFDTGNTDAADTRFVYMRHTL